MIWEDGGEVGHFCTKIYFSWWLLMPNIFPELPYVGMDFHDDMHMELPQGERRIPLGMCDDVYICSFPFIILFLIS